LKFAPDRKYFVECFRCGIETPGYVTRYYVEKARSEDISDGMEVKQLLKDLEVVPDPLKDKTTDELISDLGF
jgi:hypothetical protein